MLQEYGVYADHWPAACKTLLLTPQNLKVFLLRLRGTTEDQLFETYQQLYDDLWRERVLRSVANFTRQDAVEFLDLAAAIPITPQVETFPLERAGEALDRLAAGRIRAGSAVLTVAGQPAA